jgi:serine/threonine-protein kinase
MKPENIYLIQRDGRHDFVKVLDFGIAKVVNPDQDSPRLTQAGMIFGTPEYMSPEQAQGLTPDHRVDVYAVGCLMYNLLTGEVPFRADSFMAVLTKHMMEPPQPLRARRPDLDIPEEVEAVCLRALEKDRDKRWQDMDAFYRALGGAGPEPFEHSGPYVAHAHLRSAPRILTSPSGVRALKTEVLVTGADAAAVPPVPDEEHPVAQGRALTKLGFVIAGVVVAATLVILTLRWTRTGPQAPPVAPLPPSEAMRAPAPPPAPPATAPATPPPAPEKVPDVERAAAGDRSPAVEKAAADPASRPAAHTRRHRANADGEPGAGQPAKTEPGGAGAGEAAPTPAELKNPFNSNP